MPKADRILANLPPTYRMLGDPSALRALADAYGGELQAAENSLVAVMRSHWLDFADAGEPVIQDLALFAALYGLAPRPDESVEEFREHLKRYVKTFLEGTVTVQGILRITAETLGLHIEDDALDTWWTPGREPVLVTSFPSGADAATLVFGQPAVDRYGADAARATLVGEVDLRGGVDLSTRGTLWIALDGGGPQSVELTTGAADPAKVTPEEIVAAIHDQLGVEGIASLSIGRLRLTSLTAGTAGLITVDDGPGDAADLVLGLRPRTYRGEDPTHAAVTGTVDLSTAVDLTGPRYLRIVVDGNQLAEIDCAGAAADPAAVDIGEIVAAINSGLGLPVATDDGRFLTLTSPTPGAAGHIAFQTPAAQDATARLFGAVAPVTVGAAARSARVAGDRDLGPGVDLQDRSSLRLAVDAEPPITLDLAGADPAATTPAEIVAAINEGLGDAVASHDGSKLTLTSSSPGPTGRLRVEEVAGDVAEDLLGLRPRSNQGKPPVTASFTSTADLSAKVDLSARHTLSIAVDGAEPVEVDLRGGVADITQASVDELANAINTALGREIASDDGAHLILVSPTDGVGGSLRVAPLRSTDRRRFVTRARVTDDAAASVLGFTARKATGTAGEEAVLRGTNDLSGGADLTTNRYLRIHLTEATPQGPPIQGGVVEVDCAGPRSRATTPAEIVAKINAAAGAAVPDLASTDGKTLTLRSAAATGGRVPSIVLEAPRQRDALEKVLNVEPGLTRGAAPGGVRFTGTVDLTAGITLPADATIRLAVDGGAPVEIVLGDPAGPSPRSLSQLVAAINVALVAQVAAHDGIHLLLTSPSIGAGSRLELSPPSTGADVTPEVLGIAAPRTYQGAAATSAEVIGRVDLTAPAELPIANQLTIAVDGGPAVVVDLTTAAADPESVTISELATAINAATTANASSVAIPGGLALRISSPTSGFSSRIELSRTGTGNAAPVLFGATSATGEAPGPAVIDGTVDLLAPTDLSKRSVLRLAVDGGPSLDVDVAGATPSTTVAGEIVAAINEIAPGLASLTPEDKLRLTSPTDGADSTVEVIPLRFLEVAEYPPQPAWASGPVAHGTVLRLRNAGAADVIGRVSLTTPAGVSAPRIADPVAGWSIRIREAVGAGGALTIESTDGETVRAVITENERSRPAAHVEHTGTGLLGVRRGLNAWSFSECRAARFDAAYFDADHFAGGAGSEEAVFDLSYFGPQDPHPDAVFAASSVRRPTAEIRVDWDSHQAGAFSVNLPAELDERFGVAFGAGGVGATASGNARFGAAEPEKHTGVVTEPPTDDQFLVDRLNDLQTGSKLVIAKLADLVPIGWRAVPLPFRDPVRLSGGRPGVPARMFLSEPGLAPRFIELSAAEEGAWGNEIRVTGRASGPAIYDLEVAFPGGRFESARQTVFGPPLPSLAGDLLRPGPIGIGLAKAAGIHADVTRDRVAGPEQTEENP
ncbi:hypothetical protein [Kribbella catacumbae]|uniref:hypothetical protein n=1 Tax=Kribbella catacumbae TaxID=460086 RepID=UPI00037EC985|nr:hypothetical protein [Kribbella catacumbae]